MGRAIVIIAGATGSTNYPVTAGAFQTSNRATLPPFNSATPTIPFPTEPPPPTTGYVTKLNATGTALIFSTFLGGSGQDGLNALFVDSEGNINLAGVSQSADFPGLGDTPQECRGTYVYPQAFLTRLSGDGKTLLATQGASGPIVTYNLAAAFFGNGQASLAVATTAGTSLASVDLFARSTSFACAVDAADFAPLTAVTPGQLVTLLGNGIGGNSPSVKLHGLTAPVLYSSSDQINVQAPYELAGQSRVTLEIDGTGGADVGERQYDVVSSEPSAFVTAPAFAVCGDAGTASVLPVAHNADGSRNSCGNPAGVESIVTIFLNGLGAADGRLADGGISQNPPIPLQPAVTVTGDAQVVSAESDPGSSNGLWAVKVKVYRTNYYTNSAFCLFTLAVDGVPVRDPLVIWLKSTQ